LKGHQIFASFQKFKFLKTIDIFKQNTYQEKLPSQPRLRNYSLLVFKRIPRLYKNSTEDCLLQLTISTGEFPRFGKATGVTSREMIGIYARFSDKLKIGALRAADSFKNISQRINAANG
jgi:hypothetical protein